MLHPRTKKPLPMFFVDLEPANNNKDIFAIRSLAYTRVVIEEPHKKQDIVQCQNCQAYNHTRRFCNLNPTCVKCAGPHSTAECSKNPNQPPLCVHCHNSHPANYRGCSFYQFLKNRRRNAPRTEHGTQRPEGISRPTQQSLQPTGPPATKPSRPTAQQPALSQQWPPRPQPSPAPANVEPAESFIPVTRATFASVVKSSPRPNPPRFTAVPPPSSADFTILHSTLNSFIDELKSLISPLIEILSRFTTFLVTNPRT